MLLLAMTEADRDVLRSALTMLHHHAVGSPLDDAVEALAAKVAALPDHPDSLDGLEFGVCVGGAEVSDPHTFADPCAALTRAVEVYREERRAWGDEAEPVQLLVWPAGVPA